VLFAGEYFDGSHPDEVEIRALADSIYLRVDWAYFQEPGPALRMGWRPERGFGPAEWIGYNEALILLVLALGSPTHPVGPEAWDAWLTRYPERWGEFYGHEHLMYAPLFVHQYSHVWIDFRGIQDEFMREKGIDYFENSRRATLSQRAYAMDNPMGWRDYGPDIWGLTASSGPLAGTVEIDGAERTFRRYWARGAARGDIRDDGTIVPTAAGGSIPFAPAETIAALKAMRARYGELVFREHGFVDAFNPTLTVAGVAGGPRCDRAGRGLVRGRLSGHRSGSHRGHDRELPERAGLDVHEAEPVYRARPLSGGVQRRLDRGTV
jgi:hypothetical protein